MGSYQKVYSTPALSSFEITEVYSNGNTAQGYPDSYNVSMPTDYVKKVGMLPIKISHKTNTGIYTSVEVFYKYEPNVTYHNPAISDNITSFTLNQGDTKTLSISPETPIDYTVYGSITKVKDAVTYQWLKNGEEIDDATSSSYSVPTDTAGTFIYK